MPFKFWRESVKLSRKFYTASKEEGMALIEFKNWRYNYLYSIEWDGL